MAERIAAERKRAEQAAIKAREAQETRERLEKEKAEQKKRDRRLIPIAIGTVAILLLVINLVLLGQKRAEAEAALASGEYVKAARLFDEAGDSGRSSEVHQLWNENRRSEAEDYAKNGQLPQAINIYDDLGDTEKADELRYEFVQDHQSADNVRTVRYLKELSEKNYKDSKELYSKLVNGS